MPSDFILWSSPLYDLYIFVDLHNFLITLIIYNEILDVSYLTLLLGKKFT